MDISSRAKRIYGSTLYRNLMWRKEIENWGFEGHDTKEVAMDNDLSAVSYGRCSSMAEFLASVYGVFTSIQVLKVYSAMIKLSVHWTQWFKPYY